MTSITVDELAALWPDAPVIDVRERDEFAEARVSGTTNVPLSGLERALESGPLDDVPGDRTVYVMCASGGRSVTATSLLREQGRDAVNVVGGITEWYRNGHPVTYGANAP